MYIFQLQEILLLQEPLPFQMFLLLVLNLHYSVLLGAATQVVFKNCAPFEKCSREIDGTLVDEANFNAYVQFDLIQ